MFDSLSDRLTATLRKLTGRGVLRPEDVDAALREVRLALLEADVSFRVVKDFVEHLRADLVGIELSSSLTASQQVIKVVRDRLVELLGSNEEGLRYEPKGGLTVVMLVGLQGSGKTTTAVKLALLARREGHRPVVAGLDLRRPAAVEQLRILADKEQVDFVSGLGAPADIARRSLEAAAAKRSDLVILDTAGRQEVDRELMKELGQLRAAVPITEVLLVADAMTGQAAVNVGQAFHEALGVSGVILTKLDGDTRGGAALSLRVATGQQIRFAGVGEKPADLEVFRADRVAARMLGMGDVLSLIEKAQSVTDMETAQQVERQMRLGHVTFEDLLSQMAQMRKLGSLDQLLEMLPGGAKLKPGLAGSERDMRRMEAIILSMTRRERLHPAVIDGSRRRRIARGSGTEVTDVNRVLRAREQLEQVLKQMGKRGRGRALPGMAGFPGMHGIGGTRAKA